MSYQWKAGYRASVPAQVAGDELDRIAAINGGRITPPDVVEESRPEEAPLHPCFEWDDWRAAELYREEQARSVIRSVYVVPDDQPEAAPQLRHVHVVLDDEPCYVTTSRAMSDADLREQVMAQAVRDLEGWRKRYAHLEELAEVFAAIGRVQRPAPRRAAKPRPQATV